MVVWYPKMGSYQYQEEDGEDKYMTYLLNLTVEGWHHFRSCDHILAVTLDLFNLFIFFGIFFDCRLFLYIPRIHFMIFIIILLHYYFYTVITGQNCKTVIFLYVLHCINIF